MHSASRRQAGAITRQQALLAGLTSRVIQSNLRRGTWQVIHRGVYATFSGPIPRLTRIWAAVLAGGRGATLSHYTAAELAEFSDQAVSVIHITIPAARRIRPLAGVVVHHSRRVEITRQPALKPPRTRVEETVMDLADLSKSADIAIGWCTSAVGRRLTTPARLRSALDDRQRSRWRPELIAALSDIADGAMSPLELRYLNDVERRHGLPAGARQVRHPYRDGAIYDDVNYEAFGLVVELDGRVAHPRESASRDAVRDNVTGERAGSVLHYRWSDVTGSPCDVAARVARTLRLRGWTGAPHACGRSDCVIG
jgi:hypothetical protein